MPQRLSAVNWQPDRKGWRQLTPMSETKDTFGISDDSRPHARWVKGAQVPSLPLKLTNIKLLYDKIDKIVIFELKYFPHTINNI